MKKRVNWIWRLVAVAVLLCSLLATAVSVGVAEAATPPTTYLDPIPQYLNDATYPVVLANVTGTARATTGFGVDTVQIQIKFTWNGTTYYWTGTGWSGVVSYVVASTAALEVTSSPWTPQYDFAKSSELPTTGDLTNGITYTISAYALDTNLEKDTVGSSRSFIYDTTAPLASTISAIGNTTTWVASSITSISGTCNDTTPGKVGKEFVQIWKDSTLNGYYDSGEYWWDGMMWTSDTFGYIPTATLGSTSRTWSLSTTTIPWTHNQSYGVEVYSVDWAGNVESSPVSHYFTFRSTLTPTTSAPAIRLDDLPSYFNGSDAATMPSITGSAKAYTNKTIQMVGVSIRDISNFMWWNATLNDWTVYDDTTWNPTNAVLGAYDTDLQVDWAFDASAVTWTDGHTYEIKARAVQSDDQKKISDTKSLTCDETAPVATVNAFVVATGLGDAVFDSLTSFSGTGTDATGGTAAGQFASIKVLIVGDLGYWTGTTWSGAPQFVDASGTATWTLSTSLVPWAHMNDYAIIVLGFDKAENYPATPVVAPFLFIRNLANPVATPTPTPTSTAAPTINTSISSIENYVTTLTSISGTANASAGVTSVQVKINRSDDDLYWTGSAWSATATWINATASDGTFDSTAENWVINASTTPHLPTFANGSTYYVWASAVSGSLNDSTPAIEHFTIGTAPTATPTSTTAPTTTPAATATPAPTVTATPSMTASGTIGTTGGTLTTSDGKVSVEFPSGTFSANTEVSIRPSTCHASDDTFTVVSGTCFTITASNTLSKDATICVKYSSSDTSKLTIGYYSEGKWHEASDVTYANGKVCGNIGHFSDWAVLVREKSEGWAWYYWVLIGIGGVIVLLAIVLLVVLPKRRDQGDVPPGSLVDDQF